MADKKVLVTGISAIDIMVVCEQFPKEDEKGKALLHFKQRGGNAANVAEVLARLGIPTEIFCNMEIGPNGDFVKRELVKYNVDTSNCKYLNEDGFPTSYIILSKETNSRTVLHSRTPSFEPKFDDFTQMLGDKFNTYAWAHFEGRGFPDVCNMVQLLHRKKLALLANNATEIPTISVELERIKSMKELVEGVLRYADVVFISKDFALSMGYKTVKEASLKIKSDHGMQDSTIVIIADGDKGAHGIDQNNKYYHSSAVPPREIVDTNGAGDTFVAAVISCLISGKTLPEALEFGCDLAGRKCGILGFKDLL